MMCSDRDDVASEQAIELARHFACAQQEQITAAVRTVLRRQTDSPTRVVLSGSGEFLARRVAQSLPELAAASQLSLSQLLAPEIATAACAYAVTQLALRF
jgi:uncharacterized hydantoinase/oxoprolinase family protein